MARREVESLIDKLRHLSEEGAASFFNEVMANEALRRRLSQAGEALLVNKRSFDRNVETILDFVNIPSKRDVRELKSRLDHLNGQLVNLSMKIDRMMAEREQPEKPAGAPRPRRRKGGGKSANETAND